MKFGLLVTGGCEYEHIQKLFRSFGDVEFVVKHLVSQIEPRKQAKHQLQMLGTTKRIPSKHVSEIGFGALGVLTSGDCDFVILIDDSESNEYDAVRVRYQYYRQLLAEGLYSDLRNASVHFLVKMLESYFWGETNALNAILSLQLPPYQLDAEGDQLHHKQEILHVAPHYREVEHGGLILEQFELQDILGACDRYAHLRTLIAWIHVKAGFPIDLNYCLSNGIYSTITGPQLAY